MAPDARQLAANTLYANLMDEVKARLECIDMALQGGFGVHAALVREICFLELRMLCEIIALAASVAHGDVRDKTTAKLEREFAADRIIQRLAEIHPKFYPYPVRVEVDAAHHAVNLRDVTEPYLTQAELPKLYVRCGEILHRGTVRKLASSKAPIQMTFAGKDFTEIARWTGKIGTLLNNHRISSIDNKKHLIVILKNGNDGDRVQVAYAESPP